VPQSGGTAQKPATALLIVDLDKHIGNARAWRDTFGEELPDLEIRIWPDSGNLADMRLTVMFCDLVGSTAVSASIACDEPIMPSAVFPYRPASRSYPNDRPRYLLRLPPGLSHLLSSDPLRSIAEIESDGEFWGERTHHR
jgi:hypothetical protein